MKSYTPSLLMLLCFVYSTVCFTSCNKDSDLFLDTVLLDPETAPIEDSDSEDSDSEDSNGEDAGGNEEEEGDESKEDFDGVTLIDDTFDSGSDWELLNGSVIRNGVMTVVANGSIGGGEGNWSAAVFNVLNPKYYSTRRYRITFEARQTSGNGVLQVSQRYNAFFEQAITSSWQNFVLEFDGNNANAGNDLIIGGRGVGDTFEIDNLVMEIIGDTSNPNVPGQPAQVVFFTDFEFNTYGYDQWGVVSQQPTELNQWEVDQDTPRTTAHPDSPLKSGRDGTGEAIWLGTYNNPNGYNFNRNQLIRDHPTDWGEHWVGFSMYIENPMAQGRILFQPSQLAGTSNRVNTISLRQGSAGQLYFSLSDQSDFVDQTKANLGYWNGAGTNTTSYFFDYNDREWIDIVIHYKGGFGADYRGPDTSDLQEDLAFDPARDGLVEIWINGNKIIDITGTTTYRYTKEGFEYRGLISQVIATYWDTEAQFNVGADVYYDNFKVWVGPNGTYQDLDPSK